MLSFQDILESFTESASEVKKGIIRVDPELFGLWKKLPKSYIFVNTLNDV